MNKKQKSWAVWFTIAIIVLIVLFFVWRSGKCLPDFFFDLFKRWR